MKDLCELCATFGLSRLGRSTLSTTTTVTSHWVGSSTCGGVSYSCTTVTSSLKSTTEPNMALVSEPMHVRYVHVHTYICQHEHLYAGLLYKVVYVCMYVRTVVLIYV